MSALNKQGLQTALEAFLASTDFKAGIISSTRARRQKSSYVVELIPDGIYRVLWDGQIGNKNETPDHVFLSLPSLDDKDLTLWRGSEQSYFNFDFTEKQTDLGNQLREALKKLLN